MAKLLPRLLPLVRQSGGVSDGATARALRALEDWAAQITERLARLDLAAGDATVGGVSSVSAGSSSVSVSPTTGDVVVDVVGLIDEVVAGTNLSGGGSSGSVTLNVVDSPTFAGDVTIQTLTQGSLLFAGAGGLVSEDNASLFWDDTNNRLGLGTASPSVSLDIRGAVSDTDVLYLRNTAADGFSAVSFWNSTGTIVGATGYGNSTVPDTGVRNRLYWRTFNSDMVFAKGAGAVSTPVLKLKNAGNLGIGPFGGVDPKAKLHLYDTVANTTLRLQSGPAGVFGPVRLEFYSDPIGGPNEWRPAYFETGDAGGFTGQLKLYTNVAGSKLSAVETARFENGTASFFGGVSLGNASTDAHVLIGTLNANSTAGSDGQVLQVVAGLPKWGAPSANVSGTSGKLAKFTASSSVGNSQVTDDGNGISVSGTITTTTHPVTGAADIDCAGSVNAAGGFTSNSAAGYILIGTRQFTSGTSDWNVTAGTRAVRIRLQGAGGGGGGTGAAAAGAAGAGGGNSGTYLEAWIEDGGGITSGPLVLGIPGSGGGSTGTDGGDGGNSSVVVNGTTYIAAGGRGGRGRTQTSASLLTSGPGANAASTGGDFTTWSAGHCGFTFGGTAWQSGAGGSSPLGEPGAAVGGDSNGIGGSRGAGGSGASSGTGGGFLGGTGGAGFFIVEEYA